MVAPRLGVHFLLVCFGHVPPSPAGAKSGHSSHGCNHGKGFPGGKEPRFLILLPICAVEGAQRRKGLQPKCLQALPVPAAVTGCWSGGHSGVS